MSTSDPRARQLRRVPVVPAVPARAEPASGRTPQERLTEALRDRADAYRADATVDLALVDVLVRMDQLEAAARTLDEHRTSLHAMAQDLQVVVADATVEREAQRLRDACGRQVDPSPRDAGGLRRRLVALTGAAAVLAALLLPSSRSFPRTNLASVEQRTAHDEVGAARSRLDAARSTAAAVHAHARTLPAVVPDALRDPAIRKQVRAVLGAHGPATPADDAVTVLAKVRGARERTAQSNEPNPDREQLADVVPLRVNEGSPALRPTEQSAPDDDGHEGGNRDGGEAAGSPSGRLPAAND